MSMLPPVSSGLSIVSFLGKPVSSLAELLLAALFGTLVLVVAVLGSYMHCPATVF
jgi:hypothetical protein